MHQSEKSHVMSLIQFSLGCPKFRCQFYNTSLFLTLIRICVHNKNQSNYYFYLYEILYGILFL